LSMSVGGRQPEPPPVAGTESPKQPEIPAPPQVAAPKEPVATINGEPISREEFGEYLIRLHGAAKLEAFVNRRIIERACESKKITVTEAEIDEELERDLKQLHVDRDEFVKNVLKQNGKSMAEWKEEVLRPRLMLSKLVRATLTVTTDDLRKEYENRKAGQVG